MTPSRVFGVTYQFLSCGDVFTRGLVHAAEELGLVYEHADWNEGNLPRQIKDFAPDLLFVVHGRKFAAKWPKPLAAQTAVWLLDEPYETDETASWSSRFDHVFISDPATLHRHTNATYLPVCYDHVLHKPGTGPRPHAVGFIGGGNTTRDRYLSVLAQQGLLTYVIGGPWDNANVQKLCRSKNIPASQTVHWYQQTQIVLNVFRERHHYNRQNIPATSLNPRVYEATACGALVISEWRPELDTLCPELPTFRTVDECVALVRAFVRDPDRAGAVQRQCAARLKDHTYAARLQTVLQTVAIGAAA